jgi:hypothetical protein
MIWHKNERAVQPKVDPANMLIQRLFLKVLRVENRAIFGASKGVSGARPQLGRG